MSQDEATQVFGDRQLPWDSVCHVSHARYVCMGLMHTNEFRKAAASLNPRSWIIRLEEKESREASNMPGSKQRSPRDIETHPKIWREKSKFVMKSTKKKVPC